MDRAQRSWQQRRDIPSTRRLNELLEAERFDEFVEGRCGKFYAAKYGRPVTDAGDLLSFAADRIFRRHRARSAALPGGWQTRWRCGALWASAWTRTRRTTPRYRAPGG